MPATAFFEMVADPDVFVGGGSVAALTGAGAGATALLVMRLNARRKSLRHQQAAILEAIAEVERIVRACEHAADEDIEILAELLDAHRAAGTSGDDRRYVAALTAAARSPVQIAATILDLMQIIDEQISLSTRFTVSDLGAAAVLASGSCRAALLTAEVNLALLHEHPGADRNMVSALDAQRDTLNRRATTSGDEIEARTRARLRGIGASKGTA